MRRSIFIVWLGLVILSLIACAPSSASTVRATYRASAVKGNSRIAFTPSDDALLIDITSPSGIGSAAIEKTAGQWSGKIVMRLHVKGVERFKFQYGSGTIELIGSSKGDTAIREIYTQPGKMITVSPGDSYWIGVTPDGQSGFGYGPLYAVTGFRYQGKDESGTVTNTILVSNVTIGVAKTSTDPRADFNVITSIPGIPIILEGDGSRISGNFLEVSPDGKHDYNPALEDPSVVPANTFEGAVEIGRGGNNSVIGVDGDGVNDAFPQPGDPDRLLDGLGKAVLSLVALLDEHLDGPANLAEGLADVCRVLAGEVHHFDGIPDDVVLAHGLEPERLDADGAAADLAVPHEESRGEGLAADVRPAGRVDEEAEHVLLPSVQPGCAVEAFLRRLEIYGELLDPAAIRERSKYGDSSDHDSTGNSGGFPRGPGCADHRCRYGGPYHRRGRSSQEALPPAEGLCSGAGTVGGHQRRPSGTASAAGTRRGLYPEESPHGGS